MFAFAEVRQRESCNPFSFFLVPLVAGLYVGLKEFDDVFG